MLNKKINDYLDSLRSHPYWPLMKPWAEGILHRDQTNGFEEACTRMVCFKQIKDILERYPRELNDISEPEKEPGKDCPPENVEVISKDQYIDLLIELDGHEAIATDIMKKHSIATLANLPQSVYYQSRKEIAKIKRVQEEYANKKNR